MLLEPLVQLGRHEQRERRVRRWTVARRLRGAGLGPVGGGAAAGPGEEQRAVEGFRGITGRGRDQRQY